MEPSANTSQPANQNPLREPTSVSSRRGVTLYRLAAISILLFLASGFVVWMVFSRLFGSNEKDLVVHNDGTDDPRVAYKGPFLNIHPDVKYVGSKVCARCHSKDLVELYARTPMGRSLIPMAALAELNWYDEAHHNPFQAFDSQLRTVREGSRVWHSQTRMDKKGQPIFQDKMEVHYAIGSGNHGHSFLTLDSDGYLFQTPISWFGKKQQFWDVSPGFSKFHRRPVTADCMYCHADRAVPREDYKNRFLVPSGGWQGIGCERCHGPGEKHILSPGLVDLEDKTGVFI
jgi:hypothetical protein